jgi:hypothetical protein
VAYYYEGANVPLWPWFENKVTMLTEHRDIALSLFGGIPTVCTLFYAWYQRGRVTHLMAEIAALRQQGTIDRASIEEHQDACTHAAGTGEIESG